MSKLPKLTGRSLGLGNGDLCPNDDWSTVCGRSWSKAGENLAVPIYFLMIHVKYYFIISGLAI